MTLSPEDWHARFHQQTEWTHSLRRYILDQLTLGDSARLLEVGCGTGAVLAELDEEAPAALFGLDISATYLELARHNAPHARLIQADAHCLPYQTGSFDAAGCHFLLLWVQNPAEAVKEMVRVVRPGGAVLLMAEPDYGGRIDYPHELSILGEWQTQSLNLQGASPLVGRRLGALLSQAGVFGIESGVLGGSWSSAASMEGWELEWRVLLDDLHNLPGVWRTHQAEIETLREIDQMARSRGERVLFVPTFYAWGHKPS
ncbi:MAG: class I SAM-dependent methyltransferase [Anaerolineales bacterium]